MMQSGVFHIPCIPSGSPLDNKMFTEPERPHWNMAPSENRRYNSVCVIFLLVCKACTEPPRDRATYNASSSEAVTYTVASTKDAPTTLTYGPPFVSLAATYAGKVIIGLNRRLDDISNTIAAALLVKAKMKNLYSIELGNEPNCQYRQA